jgi:hypothetical protein
MTSPRKRPEYQAPQHGSAPGDAKHHVARPEPQLAHKREGEPRDVDRKHESHERDHEMERECRDNDRPSKIVERVWYYDREERDEHRTRGHGRDGGHDRERDDDDDHDDHGRPGRPTRPPGVSTGRLGKGGPLTTGDINAPNISGVWVGPRADMDLPLLFMRANAADLGARPVVGVPFWESPDIFILAGVTPSLAPPVPPTLGQVALAGQPNTIYAHVWNFGNSAANEVVVEFYWVDPSLGINPGSVQGPIAQTFTSLGSKRSGKNHKVVKCPEGWTPTFVNGGHECLLVRVWDNPSDYPGEPKFDASANRHVAQRNIHVVAPGAHMLKALGGGAPALALNQPLLLKVGPLFGAPAKVNVERVMPNAVPWLQLHTGQRGVFPAMAPPTGVPTLSPPTTRGGGFPTTGSAAEQHVTGDDQHIAFSTSDHAPGAGEAHVYRVSATQGGVTFGGYTVVILG